MMNNHKNWLEKNNLYLNASMILMRAQLQRLANTYLAAEDRYPEPEPSVLQEASAVADQCLASEPRPALVTISQQFGLTTLEYGLLLLCIGMEFEPDVAILCGQAQNSKTLNYPTFSLAFSLFENPDWSVMSPERPLRYWRLVEIVQSVVQPLSTSALRADERVVNYVKGLNYLDDRLHPFVSKLEHDDTEIVLPPSQQATLQRVLQYLSSSQPQSRLPVVQVLGSDIKSKRLVLWHIAQAVGWTIYEISSDLIPDSVSELDTFSRLWQRESFLTPVALYIDAHDRKDQGESISAWSARLTRFLERGDGVFFIGTYDPTPISNRAVLKIDVAKPTTLEQRRAWEAVLSEHAPQAASQLAGQFDLSIAEIQEIADLVATNPSSNGHNIDDIYDRLWYECIATTRPRLDTLAQRINAKATWNDIVLPDTALRLLQQITNQVRNRAIVYDNWGFRERMSRGLGMIALFSGESGTGKTMAAEVIATDLGLNLYRIDLSAVVSKYIGETEKNLRKLFDAAEEGGSILFFDEADAIFGKRSQVKDSRDRYANIETNYLLQRLESYRGLAILATNLRSNMDDAFTRRLRFIINFPFPNDESRLHIWKKVFPADVPLGRLDYEYLASFDVAGGSIYNVALNAAFLAAANNEHVQMHHIMECMRNEYLKSSRLIDERKFEFSL